MSGPVANVSGTFNDWRVRDAVAIRNGDGLLLVFSTLRFDRLGWVDDARFGIDDLQRVIGNEHDYSPQLEVKLDGNGQLLASRSRYGDYGVAWRSAPVTTSALKLQAFEPGRIAGALRIDDPEGAVRIEFDLPLRDLGPLSRSGVRLPDDGGEPGQWLLARSAAVWSGDLDALVLLMSPAERSSAVGSIRYDPFEVIDYVPGDIQTSGSSLFMLKQRISTPHIDRILGGAHDGDIAWVDFAGSDGVIGHSPVTGTAILHRDRRGHWSIDRIIGLNSEPEDAVDESIADVESEPKKRVGTNADRSAGSVVCLGRNVRINGRAVEPSCFKSDQSARSGN